MRASVILNPKTLVRTVAAAAALLMAGTAQAAVSYHFESFSTFSLGQTLGSYTYVAPGFVTADTTFASPGDCAVTVPVGLSCQATQRLYVDGGGSFSGNDVVGFRLSNSTEYFFYFTSGALGAVGVYDSVVLGPGQAGRLTVAITRGAVPEPASWALMIGGFALAGGAMRRRSVAVRFA